MKCSSQVRCSHEGCKETGFYSYDSRTEMREHSEKRRNWKCLYHTNSEENLSIERPSITKVMISKKSDGCGDSLFWEGHGFVHGPGFRAWPKHFPEGTKITITATVELPNALMEKE